MWNIVFSKSIWVLLGLIRRGTQHQIDQEKHKIEEICIWNPWLPDLLCKHWFTSSVWNFCRWVEDVPPRETSLRVDERRRNVCRSQASQLPSLFDIIYLIALSFAFKREASALHRPFCLSGFNFYISGNFFPTARALIGYFKVTWHLTIKLFPAKISEQIYDVREWDCAVTRESWPTSVVTAWFNEFPELQISSCMTKHLNIGPSGNN